MAQYASSSHNRHLPRESTYPTIPSSDFLNSLEDCVLATEGCSRILNSGLSKLEPGTRDLPRLTKVMRHKHHFLVLPEPTILAHKSELASTLAPQIDQLIVKAENMVEHEKSKVSNLEERLKILESARAPPPTQARTSSLAPNLSSILNESSDIAGSDEQDTSSKISDINMRELSILQRKKVMMLKSKRERLEKELERLRGGSN